MKSLVFKGFLALCSLFFMKIQAEEKTMPSTQTTVLVVETTQGIFEVTLKPDIAPKACENFMTLAENGYYNGITFHRIIKDFMIQGGDPTGTGGGGQSIWNKNFADEFSASAKFDRPGLLAMANRGPNTNGSQFFITTIATPWLDKKHTIFGEVTSGYDVVQKMSTTKTDEQNRPVEVQKILKISVKN